MQPIADNLQVFHGFASGANWISGVIRALDVTPYKGQWYEGRWSHTYWLFRWTLCSDCMDPVKRAAAPKFLELVYESHWKGGVQITPYARILEAQAAGRLHEHVELATHYTPAQAWALWGECVKIHGTPYDRTHLVNFFLWLHYWRRKNKAALTTLPTLPWFIRDADHRYICSELTEESARGIHEDLCGNVSTPQTTSPNLQWFVRRGIPSILDSTETR